MTKPSDKYREALTKKQQLLDWFTQGCTEAEDLKIGAEHEKLIFYTDDYATVPYEGEDGKAGIKDLLLYLQEHFDWSPSYEDGNIIRLDKNGASVTLEPGGQIELSGAPLPNLHDVADETHTHFNELLEACEANGMGALGLGYHPTMTLDDASLMPMSRHKSFFNYFSSRNYTSAQKLMVSSCSTQVNLGYKNEEDMVKKLRTGLALQPVVSAMFENSPFEEGKVSGNKSTRSHITHNAANGRYGFMLPVAFEEDFGFERYMDFVLNDMPVMGVYYKEHFMWLDKSRSFSDCVNGAIIEMMRDHLEQKDDAAHTQSSLSDWDESHKLTLDDWFNHINTIWPEVRMRQWLEMRGSDVGGSEEMINALPALWVGLLYDDDALDAAYDLIKDWTEEERDYLRKQTPKEGLETEFRGAPLMELAQKILKLSEQGLQNRNIRNDKGQDESIHLKPLRDLLDTGLTQSDLLIGKYDKEWGQDVQHVFNDCAFRAKRPKAAEQQDNKRCANTNTQRKKAAARKKRGPNS